MNIFSFLGLLVVHNVKFKDVIFAIGNCDGDF